MSKAPVYLDEAKRVLNEVEVQLQLGRPDFAVDPYLQKIFINLIYAIRNLIKEVEDDKN